MTLSATRSVRAGWNSGSVDFSLGMEQRICELGFPGPLRDRLVDAVLSGVKTATSSLLADWQRDGEQPPTIVAASISLDRETGTKTTDILACGGVEIQSGNLSPRKRSLCSPRRAVGAAQVGRDQGLGLMNDA
jgi:hypothetical protein